MVIRGVNFIKDEKDFFVREAGKKLMTTLQDVVNSADFKGLACIVQTDADTDKLSPKDISVEVFAVSNNYAIAKEWAEICTEEDGCKYYAVQNMAR